MSHTSGNLLHHIIFSTQARRSPIKPELRDALFAYLGGIIRQMQGTALIINGTTDQVHMLIRIRPVPSAAEIARVVKANSSRWVREEYSPEFARQSTQDTEDSASASRMLRRLPGTSRGRKNITRNARLRKNSCVLEKEPRDVRRTVHMELVSFALPVRFPI